MNHYLVVTNEFIMLKNRVQFRENANPCLIWAISSGPVVLRLVFLHDGFYHGDLRGDALLLGVDLEAGGHLHGAVAVVGDVVELLLTVVEQFHHLAREDLA
jgi:hypothetical protein